MEVAELPVKVLCESAGGEFAASLAKAKSKFRVARKSGVNTFFKSPDHPRGAPYSTVQDVDEAISEALCAEGFAPITVHPFRDGDEWIARGILRHKSGSQIHADVPLLITKRDMQGWKSAMTYASRMLIVALTGCVSGEADDDGNATVAPQQQSRPDTARQAANGMTAEAELRVALDSGDEAAATKALAKVKLRAKRKEIDPAVAVRAEAAFDKVFAKETANV